MKRLLLRYRRIALAESVALDTLCDAIWAVRQLRGVHHAEYQLRRRELLVKYDLRERRLDEIEACLRERGAAIHECYHDKLLRQYVRRVERQEQRKTTESASPAPSARALACRPTAGLNPPPPDHPEETHHDHDRLPRQPAFV